MITDPQAVIEAYEEGRIKRILLIRISRVGDLIFTTAAVRCLKARFPKAEIHYLTNPYSARALRGSPHIARVHLLDRKGPVWRFFRMGRAVSDLRKSAIDLVIPLRWRKEYETLIRKIGGPMVYQLREEPAADETTHRADAYLSGVAPLGVEDDGRGMEVFFDEDDETAVGRFLKANGLDGARPAVFHAGCHQTMKKAGSGAAKRIWPIGHWAKLVRLVTEKTGTPPVLTGFSKGDRLGNEEILGLAGVKAVQFIDGSLNRLAALLSAAGGFICGDTGPLHVASAAGVPTVALFGPTRPAKTGPYRNAGGSRTFQVEIECGPCKGRGVKCLDNICMQRITPCEVADALLDLMKAEATAV